MRLVAVHVEDTLHGRTPAIEVTIGNCRIRILEMQDAMLAELGCHVARPDALAPHERRGVVGNPGDDGVEYVFENALGFSFAGGIGE